MLTRTNNRRLVFSALSGLCLVVAGSASAAHPEDGEANLGTCTQLASGETGIAEHIFDMSDTDGDDALSPDEFKAAGLERYGVGFEAYDVDEDGFASIDEYLDFFEAHHPSGEMI